MALIVRIDDTHASLWAALDVRPPRGDCAWPVSLRFVEGRGRRAGDSQDGLASCIDADLAHAVIDRIPGRSSHRIGSSLRYRLVR